jgi:hypothetical protein
MRNSLAILLLVSISAMNAAASTRRRSTRGHSTGHPTRREYVHKTYGKGAALAATGTGAFNHLRNSPKQWGRSPGGFGKRVASAFGTHAIKNTIEYGVAGIRHEDLHYQKSTDRRFSRRLRHALVSTVVTHKTTTGKRTAAAGKISGSMGAGLISRTWQPAAMHTVSSGVATGGILLGGEAAANVAREFIPARRHRHRRRG